MNTQLEEVPIWVENRTGQRRDVRLECTEKGAADPLVLTEFELGSGEERSVYAESIGGGGEYVVIVRLASNTEKGSFSGDGVRDIEVEIRSVDDIWIESISA